MIVHVYIIYFERLTRCYILIIANLTAEWKWFLATVFFLTHLACIHTNSYKKHWWPGHGILLELHGIACFLLLLCMLRRYYGVTVMRDKLILNVRDEMLSVAVWEHIDLHFMVTALRQIVMVVVKNCLTWLRSCFICVQRMRPVKWHFLNRRPINGMLTSAKSHSSTIYRGVGSSETVWLVKNKSLKFN